ncbi:MAG: type II secretion system protein [Deltaproteobacteria bacterium]|nr:type II secretion system protein [Deltaproteobacteria bacterium]
MKLSQSGFTLIEVLVGMVIFAISSLAVAMLMVNHTQLVSLNSQSSEAIALAQDKLEDLRTMNYTDLASNSAPPVTKKGVGYTTSWTVQQNTPATNMTTLTVTVAWNHKGVAKNYVAKSIFSSVTPS